jgi:hypothetical protein
MAAISRGRDWPAISGNRLPKVKVVARFAFGHWPLRHGRALQVVDSNLDATCFTLFFSLSD